MNRRGFLGIFATGIGAAATLDPERLLWIPGKKKIFIPPPPSLELNTWIWDAADHEIQKCLELIWDGNIEPTFGGKWKLDRYMREARDKFEPFLAPHEMGRREFEKIRFRNVSVAIDPRRQLLKIQRRAET